MANQPLDTSLARRGLMGTALVGAAMATFATRAQAAAFPTHPKWKFVFVNHVTTNPFFVPTQYGIQDACGLVGCDYQWTGSATSNAGEMVNSMNAAIADRIMLMQRGAVTYEKAAAETSVPELMDIVRREYRAVRSA